MMKARKSDPAKKKGSWAAIAGLLAAAILIFDFITKAIGVTDKIMDICCAPEPVPPTVAVSPVDADWGGQCLEFAFENLPKEFVLGRIKLDVKSAKGPSQIGGNQAAKILTRDVHEEMPATIFMSRKPIEFNVSIQAEREEDALYINYCPTLNRPGLKGSLTVMPEFLTPTGKAVTDLRIVYPEPETDSVTFSVSRPRNLVPRVVPNQTRSDP